MCPDATPPTPPAAAVSFAEAAPSAGDPTPATAMARQLGGNVAPVWQGRIDRIGQIVERAESLEALDHALLAAFADLPADGLAAAMQAGFEAAHLAGRFDVASE